jgi:hypothetical protein
MHVGRMLKIEVIGQRYGFDARDTLHPHLMRLLVFGCVGQCREDAILDDLKLSSQVRCL